MTLDEFQSDVEDRSWVKVIGIPGYIYPALGLAGETGEVIEEVKKSLRKGLHFQQDRIPKIEMELGDVLFYVAMLASSLDLSLEELAGKLFKKLDEREAGRKQQAQ